MYEQFKMLEALENGKVLKSNHEKVQYFKRVDGRLYSSDRNDEQAEWKKSPLKRCAFKDEKKWIIL